MNVFLKIFFLIIFTLQFCFAQEEPLYILNDNCIVNLYTNAEEFFNKTDIYVIKDPHGLILRFEINKIDLECEKLPSEISNKIKKIGQFLAKMNNPAIIEVHINEISNERYKKLKKWEISTLIANKIESEMFKQCCTLTREKINSVGYGEFLPPKNTSNNGGKYPNRVDIMILCDVNGE